MRHARTLIALTMAAALTAGCETQQKTETAYGTGAGVAAGALLGAAIGGGRGAAVGAGVGGGLGAAVGYNWGTVKEKLGMATKGSAVQVSEQKDGTLKVNVPGSVSFASGSSSLDTKLFPTLDRIAIKTKINDAPDAGRGFRVHGERCKSRTPPRPPAARVPVAVGLPPARRAF